MTQDRGLIHKGKGWRTLFIIMGVVEAFTMLSQDWRLLLIYYNVSNRRPISVYYNGTSQGTSFIYYDGTGIYV
jgi:hypothetical protein